MKYDFETALRDAQKYESGELGIVIEGRCEAACPYCLTAMPVLEVDCNQCNCRIDCRHCADKRIADAQFLYKLKYFLFRTLNPKLGISLTGGEPTTSSRVWETIDEINRFSYARKTVMTNGLGLFREREGESLAKYFADTGWEIVLHRDHWDDTINNSLMGYSGPTKEDIGKLLEIKNIKLSFNCVLQRRGIGSADSLIKYCEYSKKHWNGSRIMFSEIQYDDRICNDSIFETVIKEHVSAATIKDELLKIGIVCDKEFGDDAVRYLIYSAKGFSMLGCNISKINERKQKDYCGLLLYPDGNVGGYI